MIQRSGGVSGRSSPMSSNDQPVTRITRRELMSAALVTLGAPLVLHGRDTHATSRTPVPPPTDPRWTAEAVTELRKRQEVAYAKLGKRLGIDGDAMNVYRSLTTGRMTAEWISPEKYRKTFGTSKRDAAGRAPEAQIAEYWAKYGNVQPPRRMKTPICMRSCWRCPIRSSSH